MGILTLLRNAFGRPRKGPTAEAEGAEQAPAQEPAPTAARQPEPKVPAQSSTDDEHELVSAAFDNIAVPKPAAPADTAEAPTETPAPEPAAEEPESEPEPAPEPVAEEPTPEPEAAPEPEAVAEEPTPEPEAAPEPEAVAEAEAEPEADAPQAADGEQAPQGPPAPDNETRTGGAGGNDPAEGEAEAEQPPSDPEPTAEAEPEADAPQAADSEQAPQGPPAPDNDPAEGQCEAEAGTETEPAAEEPQPAAEETAAPATPLTRLKDHAPALTTAYYAAASALAKYDLTGTRAKVYLVLDRSASMRPYYKDGSAQALGEQTLALAAHLDPEATVQVVFFSTEVDGTGELTLAEHENRVDDLHGGLGRMGRTSYHAAVDAVLTHRAESTDDPATPALVIFQTDGAPDAKTPATQSLTDAAKNHPGVFFSFVAFGEHDNKAFDYLRKLKTDTASFFHAGPTPRELTDQELYEGVLANWRP
ncbi:VWA domain-containing protein [Streptomyces sp. NPDC014889]|uniref:VWA domain-containing protein n=1 Tax=Streptomyces sp. NPDC014889 TaxID=3364928 RepID=UPI0036FD2DB5